MLTTKKRYKNAQNRRGGVAPGSSAKITRRTPILVVSVAIQGLNTIRVCFDQAVVLVTTPTYYAVATAGQGNPVSVAPVVGNPSCIDCTYSFLVAGFSQLTVVFEDRAVRNKAGGYVVPGVFFPAE